MMIRLGVLCGEEGRSSPFGVSTKCGNNPSVASYSGP